MKIVLFAVVLITLISFPIITAHEVEEGIEGMGLLKYIIAVWDFHDASHWIIFVFFIGTCYYTRFLFSRLTGHPVKCGHDVGKNYKGEFFLNKFHRYFFLLMFIFILIHLTEIIFKTIGFITYNFALFKPYIWPFTSENLVRQEAVQIFGTIVEWFYVGSFLVFLSSCHYFRYFGECYCKKIYKSQSLLNRYHGHLFWIGILSVIALLLLGGHL